MRPRQRHRHIHVVGVLDLAREENRHDEARIDRVDHDIGVGGPDEFADVFEFRRIHLGRLQSGIAEALDDLFCSRKLAVREDQFRNEIPTRCNSSNRPTDSARTYY